MARPDPGTAPLVPDPPVSLVLPDLWNPGCFHLRGGEAGSSTSPGPLTHTSWVERSRGWGGTWWEMYRGHCGCGGAMTSPPFLGLCSLRSGGRGVCPEGELRRGGQADVWDCAGGQIAGEERARRGKDQAGRRVRRTRVSSHTRLRRSRCRGGWPTNSGF